PDRRGRARRCADKDPPTAAAPGGSRRPSSSPGAGTVRRPPHPPELVDRTWPPQLSTRRPPAALVISRGPRDVWRQCVEAMIARGGRADDGIAGNRMKVS